MDKKLEKKYRKIILFLGTVARLLYAVSWKNNDIPTVVDLLIFNIFINILININF